MNIEGEINELEQIIENNFDETQIEKKVFDLIPKDFPRIISIGRLDFMSEGLILLLSLIHI